MFSRKKIAVVSGILSGLAVTFAGAAEAYAGGPSDDCTRDAQRNRICIHKSQSVHTGKDGRYSLKQTQHCSTASRNLLVWLEVSLLDNKIAKLGPAGDCSNTASAPKNLKYRRLPGGQPERPTTLASRDETAPAWASHPDTCNCR
ncbi:hypothetical protein [Streptomyces chattanoogensis]|uniref:hypothetical protein n=1 Tax=Streptomyces chattanoogensis TaxID=66876 RepID=UPI0006B4972B|nr:hypothetical protein [Streptomyces chattanoogensis]